MKENTKIAIMLAVTAGLLIFKPFSSRKITIPSILTGEKDEIQEEVSRFPQGWSQIDSTEADFKLSKEVEEGLRPEVVLISSKSEEAIEPGKYVDRLLAGAKSAVPSLVVVDDGREEEGEVYLATISAYYYNSGKKVDLMWRVYIKGNEVYTLTASFEGEMRNEIDQIFDTLAEDEILI
jgi:hypothetical protein